MPRRRSVLEQRHPLIPAGYQQGLITQTLAQFRAALRRQLFTEYLLDFFLVGRRSGRSGKVRQTEPRIDKQRDLEFVGTPSGYLRNFVVSGAVVVIRDNDR